MYIIMYTHNIIECSPVLQEIVVCHPLSDVKLMKPHSKVTETKAVVLSWHTCCRIQYVSTSCLCLSKYIGMGTVGLIFDLLGWVTH